MVPGSQDAQAKQLSEKLEEQSIFKHHYLIIFPLPVVFLNNQTKHNFFHYVYLMYHFAFGFFLNVFFISLHQYSHFLLNKPQPCQDFIYDSMDPT